eukprot:1157706-Pelagomonas_calceolata.AAC.7
MMMMMRMRRRRRRRRKYTALKLGNSRAAQAYRSIEGCRLIFIQVFAVTSMLATLRSMQSGTPRSPKTRASQPALLWSQYC